MRESPPEAKDEWSESFARGARGFDKRLNTSITDASIFVIRIVTNLIEHKVRCYDIKLEIRKINISIWWCTIITSTIIIIVTIIFLEMLSQIIAYSKIIIELSSCFFIISCKTIISFYFAYSRNILRNQFPYGTP